MPAPKNQRPSSVSSIGHMPSEIALIGREPPRKQLPPSHLPPLANAQPAVVVFSGAKYGAHRPWEKQTPASPPVPVRHSPSAPGRDRLHTRLKLWLPLRLIPGSAASPPTSSLSVTSCISMAAL